jgi:hypothetical protein
MPTKIDRSADVSEAVRITPEDAADELRDFDEDEAMTRRALEILESQSNDAYEAALSELREDTQGWWADTLTLKPDELEEDEGPATADAAGLRGFLERKVLPWFAERKEEIGQRPYCATRLLANRSTPTSSNGSVATMSVVR